MIPIIIIAIVLLIGVYLLVLQSRSRAGPPSYQLSGRREPFESGRHPAAGRDDRDLVVEFEPEPDLTIEVSEEIVPLPPEAEIDFSKYPEFGEDYVVLIARDPEFLFTYWEVTFRAIDAYARATGDRSRPAIVLRIHNASDPSPTPWFFDIPVGARVGNYYARVPPRGMAFHAEIGLLGSFGFWPVARSNTAAVPKPIGSDGLAGRFEEYALKARMGLGISSR
jgi:hypothetical protein